MRTRSASAATGFVWTCVAALGAWGIDSAWPTDAQAQSDLDPHQASCIFQDFDTKHVSGEVWQYTQKVWSNCDHPVTVHVFTDTGHEQIWTIPPFGDHTFTCKSNGSDDSCGAWSPSLNTKTLNGSQGQNQSAMPGQQIEAGVQEAENAASSQLEDFSDPVDPSLLSVASGAHARSDAIINGAAAQIQGDSLSSAMGTAQAVAISRAPPPVSYPPSRQTAGTSSPSPAAGRPFPASPSSTPPRPAAPVQHCVDYYETTGPHLEPLCH